MEPQLYQQMHRLEDRHWWFRGRRRIVDSVLASLSLADGARLLDVGCGTGGNLPMLAGHGAVTGFEPDEAAAELASQRAAGPVLRGSLPHGLKEAGGGYDCVTLLDVLEHIEDDAAALRAVGRLLAPAGFLLITVPAFPSLWGPHDEAHHHYRRYRADGLRARLQAAGFTVLKLSYFNSWLFPPIALLRLLKKGASADNGGDDLDLPPGWLNRVLEESFASERFVLRHARFPFGVSLLAVAQSSRDA